MEEDEVEEDVEEVDPLSCKLKLRLDGRRQVHEAVLHRDDPLSKVLEVLGIDAGDKNDVQLTCAAKRLVVKSCDEEAMAKTLGDYGLTPAAAIVVKIGSSSSSSSNSSSLKDRAADKKRKKGSHTMQSIGIYSKDDNNKAELIDGGGGVWYEHDVSDDEAETNPESSVSTKEEMEEMSAEAPEENADSDIDSPEEEV